MRMLHIIHFDVYCIFGYKFRAIPTLGVGDNLRNKVNVFIILNFDESIHIALKGAKLNNNVRHILCDDVTVTRI